MPFPLTPGLGQVFTVGGSRWRWDGRRWVTSTDADNVTVRPIWPGTPGQLHPALAALRARILEQPEPPPPPPPPVQELTGIYLSNTSFTGGAASGTIVGSVAIGMTPPTPAFSGTWSVGGTHGSSFARSGDNLVTSGVVQAGTYNITITATQAGISGSPRSQNFSLTGTAAEGPGPLPPPAVGQTALDFSWAPGPDSVGAQTVPTATNIPFQCRIVRAVVRLTTSNTAASQGWITHYTIPTEHVQISDFFALNQAPALIEVPGIQTTRVLVPGGSADYNVIHFRSTSGVAVTSAATARVFLEPA